MAGDWWQASDGNWYPSNRRPPPASTGQPNWLVVVLVIGAVILVGAVGCGALLLVASSDDPPRRSAPERSAPQPPVDWNNYSPEVKARIDRERDCGDLQDEFDNADGNNTAQRRRTGDGNSDLMAYIDARMSWLGCYG